MNDKDIWDALRRLEAYVESREFKGYDCYDALRSPLLRTVTRPSRWARIMAIQFLKRCPLNVRPFFGVSRGYNPKGLGLFLSGASKLFKITTDQKYLKNIDFLDTLLLRYSSKGFSGMCWGYNFDWQSRVFYVPAYTPTIVNSTYIAHGYLDAFEATGKRRYLEHARSTCDFILNDLNRVEDENGWCFSYTPIDHLQVHNANILGSALLARVYSHTGENELADAARLSAGYVARFQLPDGAWHYAETNIQQWIDSFHTGFVIESMYRVYHSTKDEAFRPVIERGLDFYVRNFFESDGSPKYFHDHKWPLDIHSAAQAIVTLSTLSTWHASAPEVLRSVLNWTLSTMQSSDGYFYFQRHPHYTNRIPYMRWSQAWMYHALTTFLSLPSGGPMA